MIFNINNNVKIKLNPVGRKIISERDLPFCVDADGYVTASLNDVMFYFGGFTAAGKGPFQTDIQILEID